MFADGEKQKQLSGIIPTCVGTLSGTFMLYHKTEIFDTVGNGSTAAPASGSANSNVAQNQSFDNLEQANDSEKTNKLAAATLTVDQEEATQYLKMLGYLSEYIYLRAFYPSDDPRKAEDKGRKANKLDWKEIEQWQQEGRGVYVVVNGCGHRDKDITSCRAIFYEHDVLDKQLQLNLWQQLALPEPTMQVDTGGKSIHSYWVFDATINPEVWKKLQTDLLEYSDGDRTLKNPSRVMRLPGAWHLSAAGVQQSKIVSCSGTRYSYDQLRAAIPAKQQTRVQTPEPVTTAEEVSLKVPLYQCLTKDDRALIDSGAGEGSRNASGAKLARNLIGTAQRLQHLGHCYDGDPKQLFDEYCARCSPALEAKEADTIWRSAEKDNPTSTLTDEAIENCVKGWQRNQSKSVGKGGSTKSSCTNNGSASDSDRNPGDTRTSQNFNLWHSPASWNGELGYWVEKEEVDPVTGEPVKNRVFYPKANFDFQIEKELASVDGINSGGLVLQVKRSVDGIQHQIVISSLAYGSTKEFEECLKKALGKGLVCNLKSEQVKALIHVRLQDYRMRGGLTYRLQDRVGQQCDGHWVFENCQITKEGDRTTTGDHDWVVDTNLGGEDRMPSPKIAPPDSESLKRLVVAMHKFFGDSSISPAILALGFAAAGLHYKTIMQSDKRFPLMNLYGDAGTGKSVMAACALSLVGWLDGDGMMNNVTESKLFETLKLSGSLVQCWDDPTKSREIDEVLKKVYNGLARVVRGNYQKPHAPLLLTANHVVGDSGQIATYTRVIQIPTYRTKDGDTDAWDELTEAQKTASGCLLDLIKLGYPVAKIRELEKELRNYLPRSHPRIASSVALVLWYAMAVCDLAGFDRNRIKNYVIHCLCPSINAADSNADSLTDFIDKLTSLQSESLIGDWNCRIVDSEGSKWLAVQMTEVWSTVEKNFSPIYSRKVLEAQISQSGGKPQSVQKFHKNRDESLAYYRALLLARTAVDEKTGETLRDPSGKTIKIGAPDEPEYKPKRCVLVPIESVKGFFDGWKEPTSPNPTTDPPPNQNQLQKECNQQNYHTTKGSDHNPVTSVTSSYSELQKKCNQQDYHTTKGSGDLSSLVTSFEKKVSNFLSDDSASNFVSDPWSEDGVEETKKPDTLSQKNVTGLDKKSETTAQQTPQQLHTPCNEDVTGCNQSVEKVKQKSLEPLQTKGYSQLHEKIDADEPLLITLGESDRQVKPKDLINKHVQVKVAGGVWVVESIDWKGRIISKNLTTGQRGTFTVAEIC